MNIDEGDSENLSNKKHPRATKTPAAPSRPATALPGDPFHPPYAARLSHSTAQPSPLGPAQALVPGSGLDPGHPAPAPVPDSRASSSNAPHEGDTMEVGRQSGEPAKGATVASNGGAAMEVDRRS